MKKLIDDVENAMSQSLAGFCAAHSDIVRMGGHAPFVQRRHLKPGKVALISGGGSGHEPLHTGFVGYGMLDAAARFSPPRRPISLSPPPRQRTPVVACYSS
jgi:phosphoenolpyruvate---glycerone phosphotransferase subunit DhaK